MLPFESRLTTTPWIKGQPIPTVSNDFTTEMTLSDAFSRPINLNLTGNNTLQRRR